VGVIHNLFVVDYFHFIVADSAIPAIPAISFSSNTAANYSKAMDFSFDFIQLGI